MLVTFHPKIQDPLGQQVYAEYHAFLEVAKTEVCRGLLLDLHGQNHQQNSIGALENRQMETHLALISGLWASLFSTPWHPPANLQIRLVNC